ncbi:hypothetical protein ACA910_005753 [Epithemia clementina (nom. ined.)]
MKYHIGSIAILCHSLLVAENHALVPLNTESALSSKSLFRWSNNKNQWRTTRSSIHGSSQRPNAPLSMSTVVQDSHLQSSANSNEEDEKESMRKSIEAMREEARKRLEALSKEVSDYKVEIENHHHHHAQPAAAVTSTENGASISTTVAAPVPKNEATALDKEEEEQPQFQLAESISQESRVIDEKAKIHFEDLGKNSAKGVASMDSKSNVATPKSYVLDLDQPIQVPHADASCLEDTRWKIVFDLGREPGTWMPKTWGASGDRLRFSVVVDLTSAQFYGREEFFDGLAGARVLKVVEATMGPSYWDRQNHGQEQIKVGPIGGYKVVRGAGPMGTDTMRFFIEIQEEIVKKSKASDVVCPAGRIYGNCGYFPVQSTLVKHHKNLKEALQEEYKKVAQRYEKLLKDEEEDTRFFSMDQLSRAKDLLQARSIMKRLEQRIQEARQREPDRSQLRLSRRGDVGLSKEGGVCLKVQKGLALEYHILGRMEVASVHKELPDNHEEFEDLVHKLQP